MGAPYKPLKIYKASAGSGKTYALAKEYVKILIRNPSAYRQILAITFTRKATAEMKSRILKFLRLLRDGQDAELRALVISEIKQDHGFDPSGLLEKHAGEALGRILHDYAHFQVTTIDSFFQHIIRSFAKELNLPIGMAVELDTERVLDQCVDALMEDYEKGEGKLSAWLENFAFSKMDEAQGWKIERNLMKMSRELVKEHYLELQASSQEKPELENYDKLLNEMKQRIRAYKDTMHGKVQEARTGIEDHSINLDFYTRDSVRSFLKKAEENNFESIVTIQKMISGEQDAVPKSKATTEKQEAERMKNYWEGMLKGQCAGILDFYETNKTDYHTAKHVMRHLYALALMDLLADKLKDYREEENTLLISDANHIIGKIAGEEASPFIFEKTGTFLRYLLIDEFQDTSQMQWSGLLPMVLEIVSQGTGLSLIVGDPKQSIYRWRGGKMELLLKQLDQDLRQFDALKEEIPLNTNYRSAPEIIEFNNALFEALKTEREPPVELFQLAYRQHEQRSAHGKLKGYVDYRWLQQEKEQDDVMLPEILSILREAGSRRAWKDICILVRKNQEAVEIANFLSSEAPDIPFVSGESLLVNSALSVKLLIAAMEFVLFPEEDFYRTKLNYLYTQYFEQASPEAVLKKDPEYYFYKHFETRGARIPALQKMTLDELVPALVRLLELDKRSDAYLLRLQDIVFDFVRDKELSVAAFLEHWSERQDKYAILPPESLNAVTISTVHKAKGLEYPVVIIPYLNWKVAPKPDTLFWGKGHKQLSDKIHHFPLDYQSSLAGTAFAGDYERETELGYVDIMNVLYVAFTRPREELYVLSRNNKTHSEKNLSSILKKLVQRLTLTNAVFENDRFVFGNVPVSISTASKELPAMLPAPPMKDFKSNLKLKKQDPWNEFVWEGDVLHEMLAIIERPEDIQKAARMIALKYGLSKEVTKVQITIAEAVMQIFREHQWLDPQYRLLNEHTICIEDKAWRPDKVLIGPETCVIVDYKTGAPAKEHIEQLEIYKRSYESLLNVPVNAYLLYTREMQLQEI